MAPEPLILVRSMKGPVVTPPKRSNIPVEVHQTFPLAGEVGAVPAGQLKLAPPATDAASVRAPLKVSAATVAVPVMFGLESTQDGAVSALGSVVKAVSTPEPFEPHRLLFAPVGQLMVVPDAA